MRNRFIIALLSLCGSLLAAEPAPVPAQDSRSPVEDFRQWLALPPAQRPSALADKAPAQRDVILAKLKEYEALPQDVRDVRLRLLELRWFLRPLLEENPASRAGKLPLIPAPVRALVERRLQRWEELGPEAQQQILGNEEALQNFLRLRSPNGMDQELPMPAGNQGRLEAKLQRWEALPAGQREKLADRFHTFFELSSREREKTLRTFPQEERLQMQKTLEAFERLSPEQRRVCIASFSRLATMAPGERTQFLKNAERWQTLTPRDRSAWTGLVRALPPLPGDEAIPPPLPRP